MTPCTCCGCEYDAEGFYTQDGEIIQPCKICRCDQASVNYYNNAATIREQRRNRYYADLATNREKERNRKRLQRASLPAQMSVL